MPRVSVGVTKIRRKLAGELIPSIHQAPRSDDADLFPPDAITAAASAQAAATFAELHDLEEFKENGEIGQITGIVTQ